MVEYVSQYRSLIYIFIFQTILEMEEMTAERTWDKQKIMESLIDIEDFPGRQEIKII